MPASLDGNPTPISSPQRNEVIQTVAHAIMRRKVPGEPLLVGIDGIDGSGKSTFADELTGRMATPDVTVVRSTVDSFHNPRHVRWAKGKSSPVGFFHDSHDLDALRSRLLDPMRSGPGATYRTAAFDEPADRPVDEPAQPVTGDEILLFDGIFLRRAELADYWDYLVFLDAQDRVNLERLGYVAADAPPGGDALIDHVLNWVRRIDRYSSGLRFYLDSANPAAHADVVIDNNDLGHPTFIDGTPASG